MDTNETEGAFSCVADHAAPTSRLVKTPDAAAYLSVSVAFLKKARRGLTTMSGPKFLKIGARVYYPVTNLNEWLDQFKPMTVLPKSEDDD